MVVNKKKLKLSASKIKTYEQCPRKYFYQYIEKPDIPRKEWPHLRIGNFVHDVLDKFHTILQTESSHEWPTLMTQCCKNFLRKYKLDKGERKAAKDMLAGYLTKLDTDGLPNVVAAEQKFTITLDENVLLTGFIDRIDDESTDNEEDINYKYHIVDYKSGKSKYLDDFQLLVYGLYLLDKAPNLERFKGSYIMLAEESRHHMPSIFTRTDLDRVKAKILKVADDIMTNQTWETKPQFLCKFCDFNAICPDSPHRQAVNGRKEW
jgi:DNA helicase-2/ATP-dependent DNA helicase PcrA